MYQEITKRKANKKNLFLLAVAIVALPVWGGQVDENTARRVASQTLLRSSETQRNDSTTQLKAAAVSQKTVQLLYKSSSSSGSGSGNAIEPTQEVAQQWTKYLGTNNNEEEK